MTEATESLRPTASGRQRGQRMTWPSATPLLFWTADYADIKDRIQRTRRLDRDEVWLPASDDSWPAFCRWHGGGQDFFADWRTLDERARARQIRARSRERELMAAAARHEQTAWEAQQRARQQAREAVSDQEWRRTETDIDRARAFWTRIDPAYWMQSYHHVTVSRACAAYGISFRAGYTGWVPTPVLFTIRGLGGFNR